MEENSPKVGNRQDPILTHIPFPFKHAHRFFLVDSELLAHATRLSTRRPSASSPPDSFRVFPVLSGSLADCDLLDHSFEIRSKATGMTVTAPPGLEKVRRVSQCFLGSDTALDVSPKAPVSQDACRINVHDVLTEINEPEADGSVRVALRKKIFLSRFFLPLFLASNVGWLCGFFQPSIQLRWPGIFELIQCQLQLFLRGGRRTFQCPSG